MKRRKTALLLALALSVTAVFTACGGSSQGGSSQAQPGGQSEATDQTQAEAADQTQAEGADQTQTQSGAETPQTIVTSSEPVADKFHIELEEFGRISGKSDYQLANGCLIQVIGEEAKLCDLKGNIVDDRPLADLQYLGWDLFYATLQIDGQLNRTGLVTAEGEVLIPFDAAIIEFPAIHSYDVRPRYLLVKTATDPASNPDEALLSITQNDKDVNYKGVLRFFDLETRQYVNGLEFAQGESYEFAQVGDNLFSRAGAVYSPDGETVYTAYGNIIMTYNHLYLTDSVNYQDSTLDANGNLLYSTDEEIQLINYDSDYFIQENDAHMFTAINAKGEPVLAGKWERITKESKGRFIVRKDENSNFAMVSPDGTEIVTSPYDFTTDWLGFSALNEDDSSDAYTVLTPGSRLIRGIENDPLDLVFTKDSGASYLVLNTGEFASADGCSISSVSKGVAKLENAEGKSCLIDVFTGKELVGFEYDQIDYLNDNYIYCENGDEIVIYKATIVPEY